MTSSVAPTLATLCKKINHLFHRPKPVDRININTKSNCCTEDAVEGRRNKSDENRRARALPSVDRKKIVAFSHNIYFSAGFSGDASWDDGRDWQAIFPFKRRRRRIGLPAGLAQAVGAGISRCILHIRHSNACLSSVFRTQSSVHGALASGKYNKFVASASSTDRVCLTRMRARAE